MSETRVRDALAAAITIVSLLLGSGGLYAGGVNANDQADLRLVAIRGMSEALAQQSNECREAVADAYAEGFRMGRGEAPAPSAEGEAHAAIQ